MHDGKVITESTIINEYLDEAFEGPPLRPSNPYWRAHAHLDEVRGRVSARAGVQAALAMPNPVRDTMEAGRSKMASMLS